MSMNGRNLIPLKYSILLLMALAAAAAFGEGDLIIAGSEPDYPPFCIVDESGEPAGFSVDLLRASADAVHMKVMFKTAAWSKLKQELADGTIEALPLVGRTPEREAIYDFTFPYYSLHGAVFVKKGTKSISSLQDLKTKTVAVMKGDNAEEYAVRENISSNLVRTDSFEDAFEMLSDGKYDAVICQRVMGLKLLKSLGIKNVVPVPADIETYSQNLCFAVREGNSLLLARLNEGLSITIADGTYDLLQRKWFTPEMLPGIGFREILRIFLFLLLPLLGILAFTSILILKKQVASRTRALRTEIAEKAQAEAVIKKQLEEKELILKEAHHRIKNSFSTIRSLLYFQTENTETVDSNDALKEAIARISSMEVLYEKLLLSDEYSTSSAKEYLENLIADIISLFSDTQTKIHSRIEIEDIRLNPKDLQALGLIVNEILTNTLKYAFPDTREGTIEISLRKADNTAALMIHDNGKGYSEAGSERKGMGLFLIKMLSEQLHGNLITDTSHGTGNTLIFSLDRPR